jgi:parvulin-like peptidyl-prolyl isomerase
VSSGIIPKKTPISLKEQKKMNPVNEMKKMVVARVNGEEINQFQLENAAEAIKAGMKTEGMRRDGKTSGKSTADHQMKSFALQKLIERELLFQEAKKLKIKVEEKEMEGILKKSMESFPSENHFKVSLVMSGISLEEYKRQLTYDMTVNKVAAQKVEALRKDTTPEEVRTYYATNKSRFVTPEFVEISYLFIKCNQFAAEKEKKEPQENLEKLRKSKEDFAELVKKHSQAPNASQGGYIGKVRRGELHPYLEIAAFKTPVNQVSEVVKTEDGFYLIKVHNKKKEGEVLTFEQVKDDLKRELDNQRGITILADYVEQLKKKAKIMILDKSLEGPAV